MSERSAVGELAVVLRGHGVEVADVGGKGAWTDRLIGAGLRVPATAVITTEAYRQVVSHPDLSAMLEEVSGSPGTPPSDHGATRARLDEAFLSVELPDPVSRALVRADASIRAVGGRVAVRSSATAEDLHGTSFAGQYRSFLDVGDRAELERTVRLVWASLWYPSPHAYRRYHGIDEGDIAMAVIVMRQIDSRRAGVAFTVDPGGRPGCVRVETVVGAGEQLVSGRVTPTVELVDRTTRPPRPTRAGDVADLALDAERRLGAGPLDLEWAEDDDGLWLLQARPITGAGGPATDDGFDTQDWTSRRWSSAGIAEMVPGVVPPLRDSVCRLVLEEAVRGHEDRIGNLPSAAWFRPLLGRVRGRIVLDEELMDLLRARAARAGRRGKPWRSASALRERRRALWESGTVTVAAVEAWERMPDLVGLDVEALVSLRRRLIDLAGRAMAAEVAIAATAVSDVARLESLLRRHLDPDDARNWALRATARPGGTIAGWPSAELDRVLSGAPVAVLRAIALASDPEEETMSLGASVNGAELLAAVFALVERAGSSAVLAGPTWDETPEAWWPVVQRAAGTVLRDREASNDAAPRESGLDELLDGLVANPEWTQARIRNLQVFDLRRFLIRRQAEEAADRLERRERTKAAVLTIGGLIRRVHLELGRRLVTAGVLEEADDVELLGEQELVHAMRGDGQLVPAPAELARRRRWLDAAADAGPLPQRFHGALPEKAPPAPTGAVLHGWGASPGRHRGPVRVVRHPTEADVDRGDVLVALSTDASWAPLFMQVGAVVVEEGGPLSHAAIVARELGLPAVVNIPGIVSRLAGPGQEVTVDGEAGTVEVHDTARSAR